MYNTSVNYMTVSWRIQDRGKQFLNVDRRKITRDGNNPVYSNI